MSTALQDWTEELASLLERAPCVEGPVAASDAQLIDVVRTLERSKGTISAVQARTEIAFRDSQVERQRRQDVPRVLLGRGVADQIALARRITPKQGSDQLTLHRVLVETLPRTTQLLQRGEISEWAAHEVAKNVLILDDEDRDQIDRELELELPAMTASKSGHVTRARAQELDPEAAVKRAQRAVSQRRVSLRPAPDGMSIFRAVLPAKEGVAAFKALTIESKSAKSSGDRRGKGQIMADTLVERVTGAATVDEIPVEINLLMTDTTLLNDEDRTAWMEGHPIPGRIARDVALGVATRPETGQRSAAPEGKSSAVPGLSQESEKASESPGENELEPTDSTSGDVGDESQFGPEPEPGPEAEPEPRTDDRYMSQSPQDPSLEREAHGGPAVADSRPTRKVLIDATRWIRRLYTDPRTGELTGADPRRRLFRGTVRHFILLRDQSCRTPWCDSAIHDVDHATRYADGGKTTPDNGIGHCQRFNLVKEIPGWETSIEPAAEDEPSTLTIITPTGHHYSSTAPSLQEPAEGAEQKPPEGEDPDVPAEVTGTGDPTSPPIDTPEITGSTGATRADQDRDDGDAEPRAG